MIVAIPANVRTVIKAKPRNLFSSAYTFMQSIRTVSFFGLNSLAGVLIIDEVGLKPVELRMAFYPIKVTKNLVQSNPTATHNDSSNRQVRRVEAADRKKEAGSLRWAQRAAVSQPSNSSLEFTTNLSARTGFFIRAKYGAGTAPTIGVAVTFWRSRRSAVFWVVRRRLQLASFFAFRSGSRTR